MAGFLAASAWQETSLPQIVQGQTQLPIAGARVAADGNGFGDAVTDTQGRFNITSYLDTGTYRVTAAASGYVDTEISVPVTAGAETSNVNILLPISGAIAGRVTDASTGQPISDAQVTAYGSTPSGQFSSSELSDANGNYVIGTNLRTGVYDVTASFASGYLSKNLTGVTVAAGSTTNGINFALARSAAVSGFVRDSFSQSPLADIFIEAHTSDDIPVAFSRTDATGAYSLSTDLATGTYDVTVLYAENHVSKTIPNVVVTSGSQYTVNILLDPSGIMSGTVTSSSGRPLKDASVTATSSAGFSGLAVTDAAGHYRISSDLDAGAYTVVASYGDSSVQTTGVSVANGQETANVNLVIPLPPSGVISGRVTNTAGTPIEAAEVTATGASDSSSGFTDSDGNYEILTGLSTGSYNVNVTAETYFSQVRSGVAVSVGQTTGNVNFQLSPKPSGRISGTVLAEGSSPPQSGSPSPTETQPPTPTPTPTAPPTSTPTASPSPTPTPTPTPTETPNPTPSPTPTPTEIPQPTPSPSPTPTPSPSPTVSPSPTIVATPTPPPSPTPTATSTPPQPTPTPTPSENQAPSPSPSTPTAPPTPTPVSASPTTTPAPSSTATPSSGFGAWGAVVAVLAVVAAAVITVLVYLVRRRGRQ